MKQRLLTAGIGVPLMILLAVFSHTVAVVIFTSFVSAVAVYEMLKCMGKEKNLFIMVASQAFSLSAQVLAYILGDGREYLFYLFLIWVAYSLVMLSGAVFSQGEIKVADATATAMMTVYISFGFASLCLLRALEHGLMLYVFWFFIPWVCDGMAYFVGRALGKHKLIPAVSPKKTVEGAIGGVVGTLVLMALFCLVCQFGFDMEPNYFALLTVTLVGCVVSQCGDLIASLIKREYGIKDYGKLYPGHGGIMDRFDSCIATGPFIYLVCVLFTSGALFF